MTSTLADLQAECDAMRGYDPGWYAKMMHRIPEAPVVDRVQYILQQCQGKRVLHLGCQWPPGPLHRALEKGATVLGGVDIQVPVELPLADVGCQYWHVDLEDPQARVPLGPWDIVVAAEILEHISNPGHVLRHLKRMGVRIVVTVPNAFNKTGYAQVCRGMESVNREHVAYYSYWTLRTLVERCGLALVDFCWYNGKPGTAEGLIFLVM